MKHHPRHQCSACQWPLTERRPWLFCERPLPEDDRTLPYCDEHHALAVPSRVTPEPAQQQAA
jgi:hypothetical protein